MMGVSMFYFYYLQLFIDISVDFKIPLIPTSPTVLFFGILNPTFTASIIIIIIIIIEKKS